MKKIVVIFIFIILFLFISRCIMVYIDKNNISDIGKDIIKNTDIKNIKYINKYDDYYIVKDNDYIYLIDYKYNEVLKIDNKKIYDNKNNYELIYRDNTIMYMDNYIDKDSIVFNYYDIYSYKLIDSIIVGGNYG